MILNLKFASFSGRRKRAKIQTIERNYLVTLILSSFCFQYTENAKKYGAILNDQETRPLDRAIWWIEHVMRHPFMYQGKTPTHKLYWFQYFSLDVFLLYAIVLYVVFKILKFLVFLVLVGCWQSNKIKVE